MHESDRSVLESALREVAGAGPLAEAWARAERFAGRCVQEGGLDEVAGAMRGLALGDLARVIRVSTARFHLLNKAEQLNIVRVNRERERASEGGPARPESLDEALERLASGGVDAPRARALLDRLDVQPTLTAHPTEARRRTVLEKQLEVAECVVELRRQDLTARERAETERRLRRVVALLLATDDVRARRLDVPDEVRNGLFFLRTTIWETVPRLARDVVAAAERAYGPGQGAFVLDDLPPMLRYRSWIGGDRDGNPRVTAEVTRRTLASMRREALALWDAALAGLQDELTLSTRRVEIDPALVEANERDAAWGATGAELEHRRYEPVRLRLMQMRSRLVGDAAYGSAELEDDLRLIGRALERAGLGEVARRGPLADALVRVRAFGLHLATLDIRQHSGVHERVVDELLRVGGVEPAYAAMDEPARIALLRRELRSARPLTPVGVALGEDAREALETLRAVAEAVARDPEAVRSYVISMTHGVSDVLEVLVLLREVGMHGTEGRALHVVPLFETVEDLDLAPRLMAELLDDPVYRAHVEALGGEQEVMLGYSDSNKDGGFLMANIALHAAQRSIAEAVGSRGVRLRYFHGRGGTIGRGGGRAGRAILSSPEGARTGRLRFTEQGEVITFRYALPAMARRHLEQIINAALLGAWGGVSEEAERVQPAALEALLRPLAERAQRAYRELIDDPAFWGWFVASSPIEHIGGLPIASRPVSRATGDALTFDSLRAIPWGFAWIQMRALVPGWFGVGAALGGAGASVRSELRELCAGSTFLRTVLENAAQEMARARLAIVRRYDALAGGDGSIVARIEEEYAAACAGVLEVLGRGSLMEHAPVVGRSIDERNPWTDVLNLAQVELLARWRGGEQTEAVRLALQASINGVAAAMQSTG